MIASAGLSKAFHNFVLPVEGVRRKALLWKRVIWLLPHGEPVTLLGCQWELSPLQAKVIRKGVQNL